MRGFVAAVAAVGFLATTTVAEAQVVRRIIGHAVAGKAVKSILGKDQEDPGKDAAGNASEPSAPEGLGAADGSAPADASPAQAAPGR